MNKVAAALEVTRSLRSRLRDGASRGAVDQGTWREIDAGLSRLEGNLSPSRSYDPYDLRATGQDVSSLTAGLRRSAGGGTNGAQPAPAPAPPPPPPATAEIGQRTAAALEAVNFPAFVASLLTGTFRAIVDASIAQVQEYAQLVASLTKTSAAFSAENVTANQVRDELVRQHPQDLVVALPPPGSQDQPRLLPRPGREGTSPAWLDRYGLGGEELSAELTDGPLIEAGRQAVGEDRMQMLATMVLMGINRVVVNEGDVRAKLQFHATAVDKTRAELEATGLSIASTGSAAQTQMMVSTIKANTQADASIRADLMGEVRISFRSETFPLERFADSQAIQLLNRHARWKGEPAAAPAPAAPTPVPVPEDGGGGAA